MSIESGVVHFTIGEDFGKTIMQIAQEHLIYNLNQKKAIKAITDSLMGCPEEFALKIIKGDMIIGVEGQECYVTDRIEGVHDDYPKIDLVEWYKRQSEYIIETGKDLIGYINLTLFDIRRDKSLSVDIPYETIINFIVDKDKDKLYDYVDNLGEVSQLASLIKVTKDYLLSAVKRELIMNWVMKTYPSEFKDIYVDSVSCKLIEVTRKFQSLCKLDYTDIEEQENEVETFIEATIEIDKVLSKGIEPVDILDNYSAGWLSPDGKYYALNGEIANMLHLQIADALVEAGIIPNDLGEAVNCDSWLEQHGWVKIHNNNINFGGCLNVRLGMKNVDMTNVQAETIAKYIKICHSGVMKLGWRLTQTSAAKFEIFFDANYEKLCKDYFEF